jgi:hypothetical protein
MLLTSKNKKMRNMKKTRFFSLGRKWVFTLALFLLVFAAASAVKIHAAGNGTGWLWGGGAGISGDGTNTNVGWISANRLNCDSNGDGTTDNVNYPKCPSGSLAQPITTDDRYGINIPPGNGDVTGYAWSEWIGWLQFDPAGPYPATDCGTGGCPSYSTKKDGINLHGWARITEIAREAGLGNSGGWQGWVKLQGTASDGKPYGVTINDDGTFCKPGVPTTYLINGKNECHGWSDELGWIDFSQVKIPMPIDGLCNTPPNSDQICPGDPNPTTMTKDQLCADYDPGNPPSVTGTWDWICSGQNGGDPMDCHTEPDTPVVPQCGINVNFCTGNTSSPCASGSASAFVNEEGYEVSWTCTGSCVDPITTNCSARGKKSCGWKEVNPS